MIGGKGSLLCFTDNGKIIGGKVASCFDLVSIYNKEESTTRAFVEEAFVTGNTIVFVGAVGIAVRLIQPFIKSKDVDPAVIVIDEKANFVIPILSGHLGGANACAMELSKVLDATPVITTATDINEKLAVDTWAKNQGCVVGDISKIKHISAAVLRGEEIGFYSDFKVNGTLPEEFTKDQKDLGVAVSLNQEIQPFKRTLTLIPKIIVLGVGCRKNTSTDVFEEFVLRILQEQQIPIKSILAITSIDLKKEEPCMVEFATKYNIPFYTFTAKELDKIPCVSKPSKFVQEVTGVGSVCEASALCFCEHGEMILPKTPENGMTICIVRKDWEIQ